MSAKPALKAQPKRGNEFWASCQVDENSELYKKPEPIAQFHWERISSGDQLSRSLSGSETASTTNSRYNSFRNQERSLNTGSLRRALGHLARNSASFLGLRWLWGRTSRKEKPPSHSVPTPYPSFWIDPGKPIFQWAKGFQDWSIPSSNCEDVDSRPVYRPSAFNLPTATWRGSVAAPTKGPEVEEV